MRGEAPRWLRLLAYVLIALALAYAIVTAGPGPAASVPSVP